MEIAVYIVILVIVSFIILKKTTLVKFDTKSSGVKKSEIIESYKKQLDELSLKYSDESELKIQKAQLLKAINQELSQNIFFDAAELKQTMQELTTYSFR